MEKQIKFTDSEIESIKNLRNEFANSFAQLGQLSIRESELAKAKQELLDKHSELANSETGIFKELNTKYGDGNYDIETGLFTPIEKPVEDEIGVITDAVEVE